MPSHSLHARFDGALTAGKAAKSADPFADDSDDGMPFSLASSKKPGGASGTRASSATTPAKSSFGLDDDIFGKPAGKSSSASMPKKSIFDSDDDEPPKASGKGKSGGGGLFGDDDNDFLAGLEDLNPDRTRKPAASAAAAPAASSSSSRDTTPTTGRRAAAGTSSTAPTPSKPVGGGHARCPRACPLHLARQLAGSAAGHLLAWNICAPTASGDRFAVLCTWRRACMQGGVKADDIFNLFKDDVPKVSVPLGDDSDPLGSA